MGRMVTPWLASGSVGATGELDASVSPIILNGYLDYILSGPMETKTYLTGGAVSPGVGHVVTTASITSRLGRYRSRSR
jgi:hypothetical protein